MRKMSYAKSVKKQLEWCVVLLFIICLVGWLLYPVNTLIKVAVFAAFAVFFTVLVVLRIRQLATAAACPSCGVDLYEVIQAARFKKILFRHCPACGENIEA